ncbi:MAG: CoA transferase [Deltaproteobacteria bacterium]|nr:CoA transferase [Deltaproteobacteria bacterium]
MGKALDGVRILDLTRVLAGPFCTMVLADLGAEVIKVELPGTGDDSRSAGPFIRGESTYFMSLNRGKKSLTLNLRHQEGKAILKELVRRVDVLIENFRPGTMKKLELDYPLLSAENPRLIYAAVSGYGQSGPYRGKPAYDFIVQGMGGVMGLTAHPGGPPTRVPVAIGDITAGLYTAIGILSGLRERDRSGKGQMIDVAMLDCQVSLLENPLARYFATGEVPVPIGNIHPTLNPMGAFHTEDRYIILGIGNDTLWKKFCEVVDKKQWIEDERFITNAKRTENSAQLVELLEELFRTRKTAEWLALLENAGIPCGPITTVDEVANDPHIGFREMIVSTQHPIAGEVRMTGVPIKMSRTPGTVDAPPPTLGEHTDEILKNLLGYTVDKIKALRHKGII